MRPRTAAENDGSERRCQRVLVRAWRQREQVTVERVDVMDEPGHGVALVTPRCLPGRGGSRRSGSLASSPSRSANASMSSAGTRKPGAPVGNDVARHRRRRSTPPGTPAASASISATGVPSFAEVSATASTRGVERPDVVAEADEVQRARRRRACRRAPRARAQRPVADEQQVGVAPAAHPARTPEQVVDPLDLGHSTEPADQETIRRDAELAPARARAGPASPPSARRGRGRAGSP